MNQSAGQRHHPLVWQSREQSEMKTVQVMVWNRAVEIRVAQKSKLLWVASGEHLNKNFVFRGRSESRAVKEWTEAARNHESQILVARLTVNRT